MNGGLQAAPSGVVTFLFTDIEGSTRRWEADADAMRRALASHDDTMRHAVEVHDGWLFKHTGDGICAAFSSPRQAVDAAVDAQRSLHLPVRMGIATGEAECREGDYFGAVCNRTARLMAVGHGGQLLIDRTTADLVSGVDLVALGPRRLRDIARPVDVFQVVAEGLRSEFPPLRTLDIASGNLRLPTTSLIGREAELGELEAIVRKHRIITLTGVGGVGKTRLALEVASRLASEFADGVFVIELAPVGDPNAIPEAAAAALGVSQQPGLTVAQSLATALEGRRRLLVFDNCEHVLDTAAEIIELICATSSTVKILATSREGLRLADEQLWPVPSLDIDSSAVALFTERAQAVTPEVEIPVPVVEEIAKRLDGIPLAIELAASRMQSMTVYELNDRLDDRFRLLVGSRRGLERHQTLRHAVQWSYDLLADIEKRLLMRCSVFAGTFDLAGASAVMGDDDDLATLDILDALVRKSLVVADRTTSRTRFSMLETIRQFSEEQLVAAGDAGEVRAAHARYFARCGEAMLTLWDGPRQSETYDWFNRELANLRTAFRRALDGDALDDATAIAFHAGVFGLWLQNFEPVGWVEEVLPAAQAAEHRRLAQLYTIAVNCYSIGRSSDSLRYVDAAQHAIDNGRYDDVPYGLTASVGGAYIATGQPQRWVEFCRRVLFKERDPLLYVRTCLAIALTVSGEVDEARAVAESLRNVDAETANPAVASWALFGYGFSHLDADGTDTYLALRRGVDLARESGNRLVESLLASSMSKVAADHGDPAEAFEFFSLAIRNFFDSGSYPVMHTPLAVLATYFDKLGFYTQAATLIGFADNPFARASTVAMEEAIAHLRAVLGDKRFDELAEAGAAMTNAAMARYALDQIEAARAKLSDA
ncbi:cyclase [Mycobacterium sp. 852002-51152_SCH6134967]|uniref:ATP-binding protein n=1 Tax=Mycobacterium sp. 852002-51152_SCH6134967 TaxID=1834096 RepID=UPI0007FF58EC|nr:adenylate/guanylate cyclase domain-containing protein [Mycobacterium sp. 852002-51152_SCH6134967]OBF89369.1 cyclase [Mycobacterium sp. 852002-51152_SCH6134967]